MPGLNAGASKDIPQPAFGNWIQITAWILGAPVLMAVIGWETLAVYYSNLPDVLLLPGAIAIALIPSTVLLMVRPATRSIPIFFGVFLLVLVWYRLIPPSNDRVWLPENERLTWVDIDGDRITVHNIRNFDYRTETDFTPAYYDKRFDLSQLESVDVIASRPTSMHGPMQRIPPRIFPGGFGNNRGFRKTGK